MKIDIKKSDYVITDQNNKQNLNDIEKSSFMYLLEKEIGTYKKLSKFEVEQLFSKNYEELKQLLQDIITKNNDKIEHDLLANLKDHVLSGFNENLSSFNFLKIAGTLDSIESIPLTANYGDVYEIKDQTICIYSPSNSWIILKTNDLNVSDDAFTSKFYQRNEVNEIAETLYNAISEDCNYLNQKIETSILNIDNELSGYILKKDVDELVLKYEAEKLQYLNKINELSGKILELSNLINLSGDVE